MLMKYHGKGEFQYVSDYNQSVNKAMESWKIKKLSGIKLVLRAVCCANKMLAKKWHL